MAQLQRPLEESRLEIVILAAGILILVSLFGVLLLVCVSIKTPRRTSDAEIGRHTAKWGGHWHDGGQPTRELYVDDFVDAVRRRSASVAEEVKDEIQSLTHPTEVSQDDQIFHDGTDDVTWSFGERAPRRRSESDMDHEDPSTARSWRKASATGKETEELSSRRRSSRLEALPVSEDLNEHDM